MIINTTEEITIVRFRDKVDSFEIGPGSLSSNMYFELDSILIHNGIALETPVFTFKKSINKSNQSFNITTITQYQIIVGNCAIVTEDLELHKKLFETISLVLTYGDEIVKNREDLFTF